MIRKLSREAQEKLPKKGEPKTETRPTGRPARRPKVLDVLTETELLEGVIAGVPIANVKNLITETRAREKRLELLQPVLAEQKKKRIADLKYMLRKERAQRGEIRGSEDDKQYTRDIVAALEEAEHNENILVQHPTGGSAPRDMYRGAIVPELRKTHDALPLKLRMTIADNGSVSDDEHMQMRIAAHLEKKGRLHDADEVLNRYRNSGKPLGVGFPGLGDSAVITAEGLKLFKSGATRDQLGGSDSADLTVTFEDLALGNATISVAPSGADGVRSVIKRLRGRQDELPATVLVTEAGSGRQFKIAVKDGKRFAEAVKACAPLLARRSQIQEEFEDIKKEFGRENVLSLLRTLDNS